MKRFLKRLITLPIFVTTVSISYCVNCLKYLFTGEVGNFFILFDKELDLLDRWVQK
jgi:hypothetical protein